MPGRRKSPVKPEGTGSPSASVARAGASGRGSAISRTHPEYALSYHHGALTGVAITSAHIAMTRFPVATTSAAGRPATATATPVSGENGVLVTATTTVRFLPGVRTIRSSKRSSTLRLLTLMKHEEGHVAIAEKHAGLLDKAVSGLVASSLGEMRDQARRIAKERMQKKAEKLQGQHQHNHRIAQGDFDSRTGHRGRKP